MAALTDYAENKLIDAIFRAEALGAPATLYFALYTSATDDAGGGTEVTGGSYARVAVTASLTNFAGTQGAGTTVASSGTSGTTSNNGAITFPVPTANWGTVTHIAILDASTSGNMWAHGALTTPRNVLLGDGAPSFAISALTFQIDN